MSYQLMDLAKNMPFRSVKQRKFMYANKPELAKKWAKKYGNKIVKKNKRSR